MAGIIIAIFLGWAGGYRFYKKQPVLGIIYLLTLGIFGIGWFADIFISIRAFVMGLAPKSQDIECQIMGSWAECKKNKDIKRWDILQTLSVGTPLTLETAYYEGAPYYQVCAPNGMDLGALPKEISQDLIKNHPSAKLSGVLTFIDREEPRMRLTISD